MKYTMKAYARVDNNPHCIVVITLDENKQWCIATNNPLTGDCPNDLCHAYYKRPYDELKYPPWIEGPRGGRYHHITGRRL